MAQLLDRNFELEKGVYMKKAFSSLLVLVAVTTLMSTVACKKNDDGGGDGGTFAATPTPVPAQNCATAGDPRCTPAQPNYYQVNAPQFTTYQWGYTNGYCGCPGGYRPVMNINWGVSCAPDYWFPTSGYYMTGGYTIQTFMYAPQNGQWTSSPLATYSPAISGSASGCGAQVSAICDTRVANSCSGGAVCRPASGGSYLGLCTNGTGVDNYQAPQNTCRFVWTGYSYYYSCGTGYYGNGIYGSGYGYGYSYSYGGMLPR